MMLLKVLQKQPFPYYVKYHTSDSSYPTDIEVKIEYKREYYEIHVYNYNPAYHQSQHASNYLILEQLKEMGVTPVKYLGNYVYCDSQTCEHYTHYPSLPWYAIVQFDTIYLVDLRDGKVLNLVYDDYIDIDIQEKTIILSYFNGDGSIEFRVPFPENKNPFDFYREVAERWKEIVRKIEEFRRIYL